MADKNFDKRELMTDDELDKVLGGFAVPIIPDEIRNYFSRPQNDNCRFRSIEQANSLAERFRQKN